MVIMQSMTLTKQTVNMQLLPKQGMGRPRKLLKTGMREPQSAAGAGLESINSVGQCRLLAGSGGGHS